MTVDTSAEAVEAVAWWCETAEPSGAPMFTRKTMQEAAATLRALLAERDAANETAEISTQAVGKIAAQRDAALKDGFLAGHRAATAEVAALLDAARREGEARERKACEIVARDLCGPAGDPASIGCLAVANAIRARGGA
jgi:hypothetical protein